MTEHSLDISANRDRREYSRNLMVKRVLWGLCQPLFRLSPRPMFEFRSWFLRLFGAQIGKNVHIYSSAIIYMPGNLVVGDWSAIGEWTLIYNLDEIVIGNKTTVSQRAHLCAGTHDFEQPDLPLIRKRIVVGDQAWVCADTFIGPGVNIGDGAVVGARAVVVKNVEPWAVVAGNPARKLRQRILKN